MGVLYYEVSDYLGNLAKHSLMQRQHLFARFKGEQLDDALATSMTFDLRTVDAYGLFDAQHRPISGPILAIPPDLPLDGQIHELANCINSDDPDLPRDSCDAVATQTQDGRLLVLVRDNGSLFAVTRIILHALDIAEKRVPQDGRISLRLAVAPLEDNLFNACKSNLRLLEYGACAIPVVCSDGIGE